jgi:hypothetical protein
MEWILPDACPNPKYHAVISIWVATGVDIATDIMLAVLPIHLLVGLRISKKQKYGLGAIFSLGLVIVAFSIIRLVKIIHAISTANPNGNVSLALWSMLETSVGKGSPFENLHVYSLKFHVATIVGSLPPLKFLISRRGDAGYSPKPKQSQWPGAKTLTTINSHTARRHHISDYDIQLGGITSRVRARHESSDALKNETEGGTGPIKKTLEISVSSYEVDRDGGLESCYHTT